ncbi:ABC transporter substrate-binding protein [Clostridium ganghwense]|uniref:ABC transporter substrate-binding protein n=1 Tax=Clostridium ganghwense TaxID=312089 RepID=A0ABT4CSS6_9CLOT|nr:ABC transporter substrate-binding protein [Clostridium ganghwense]MCY6372099.1 ABC transporter substrate-binding protein [Clostridium ganghwense]
MIKNKKMKAIVFSMILCVGAAFVGCGQKAVNTQANGKQAESKTEKGAEKLDKIKKTGKLVLGTCADYPPYEFHKMIDGKDTIVGFDIEIAKAIANDLGVELEIKDMDFDGLIPSLKTGKVDILISGMTPTEERAKQVDFSKVYYKAVQNVLIRKEDKAKFNTVESLTGKKVGAQTASVQEKIAKEELKDANVLSLGKVTDLVLSLKTKKVDAVVVEGPVAKAYADKNSDVIIADIKVGNPDDGSAIAVQKGNTQLIEAINKTIDKLVTEGKIDEFVAKANEIAE